MAESKYLKFTKIEQAGRKTPIYNIESTSSEVYLGCIYFNPAWRKFVLYPAHDVIFDAACLSDIIIKLNDLTAEWRANLKKEN